MGLGFIQTRAFSFHRDDPRHRVVTDVGEFWHAINWLRQHCVVAVDTETSGTQWHRHSRIAGVSMTAWDGDATQSFYFPCRHETGEHQLPAEVVMQGARSITENPQILKVWHNVKFDEHMFMREGVRVLGPRRDVMIEAHHYNENDLIGLKERAGSDLGDPRAKESEKILQRELARLAKEADVGIKEFKEKTGYARASIMLAGVYACWDTEFTLRLAKFYDDQGVTSFFAKIYDTEMRLTRALFQMEENGMPVDVDYLRWLQQVTQDEMDRIRPQIFAAFNGYTFNPHSDKEIRALLVDVLRLERHLWKKTDSGAWSVDAEVLGSFQNIPGLALLGKYREALKINNTYTTSIINRVGNDGLLHGDFKQVGTTSGRLAAEKPNMHNFAGDDEDRSIAATGKKLEDGGQDPWSVKRAFINRGPGWVRLYKDFSQIELRVLAFLSRDPVMLDIYLRCEDIHARTSQEVFGNTDKPTRRKAKVINFGLAYCLSADGYALQAKVPVEQARADMDRFFQKYPAILAYRRQLWSEMRSRNPPHFVNMFGRARRIPELLSPDKWWRKRAERQSIGANVQGTAAELTKESIVYMHEWEERNRAGLLLATTVHDEIQTDVPAHYRDDIARELVGMMENFPQFDPIPILVDAEWSDTNWSEKKKLPKGVIVHRYGPANEH